MRFKLGLRAVNSFLKIEKGIGKFFLLKFHLPVVLASFNNSSFVCRIIIIKPSCHMLRTHRMI